MGERWTAEKKGLDDSDLAFAAVAIGESLI